MKIPHFSGLSRTVLMLGLVAIVSQPVVSLAASYTWNKTSPTGNYSWLDAQYWSSAGGGTPLAAGDVATINSADISFTVALGGTTAKAGILNIGSTGNGMISFTSGAASQLLTMQAVTGTAAINKTSENIASYSRGIVFASDTVVTVSGGEMRFNGSASVATLRGTGSLIFEGSGGVSVFTGDGGSFATSFAGNTVIRNGGTLLVNNTFQASSTTPSADLKIGNTGTLSGTGTVARHTTVQNGGKLATGSGVGVTTFSGGLAFDAGAHFKFGLLSDTSSGRGTSFNAFTVTGGGLTFADGALFDLTLSGGTVDFSSSFWDADQEWLIATADSVTGSFSLGSISLDSKGADFSTTGGAFSFKTVGNDVYLAYSHSVIPEPSVSLLLLGGAAGAFALRRKFHR